jgi:hypothetical protein
MTTGVADKPPLRKECFFGRRSEFALLVEALYAAAFPYRRYQFSEYWSHPAYTYET